MLFNLHDAAAKMVAGWAGLLLPAGSDLSCKSMSRLMAAPVLKNTREKRIAQKLYAADLPGRPVCSAWQAVIPAQPRAWPSCRGAQCSGRKSVVRALTLAPYCAQCSLGASHLPNLTGGCGRPVP